MLLKKIIEWKNNLDEFILDDNETKKNKIKKYIYNNRNVIYSLTIIGIVLAILSSEFEKSIFFKTNTHILKGGNIFDPNKPSIFAPVGKAFKSVGTFFVNRLTFIFNMILTFIILGLIIISPLFIYLFIIYMMFKFLIKGSMKY